jgi:hypothetical protein
MRSLHAPVIAAVLATAAAAQTWVVPTPAPTVSPGARRLGAMAFDAVTNRLIAFGGLSSVAPGGALAETWAYGAPPATGNWAQLQPTGGAPARWGHRMVRNTQNNRLITFGGRSPTSAAFANDTWEYTGAANGGTWAQVATATRPSPRYLYGLAWDEARNVAVLFGGSSATATFGDTWEYNGTTWTERSVGTAPPAREEMVLVYDAALNRTVLFGGYDPVTNTRFADTWFYDGSTWTEVATTSAPSARFSSSAVYDSVRKRIVLFGGFDTAPKQDSFQFVGDRWATLSTGTTPPPNSTEAYAGFDPSRRKFVLFGGYGTTFTGATFELNVPATGPGQTGMFGTFAPACGFSGATEPTVTANAPVVGTPLQLTYSNLPTPPNIPLAVLGLSNRTYNSIPLPLDLGVLGLGGSCPLWVAGNVVASLPLSVTTANFSLTIPNNVALINTVVYTQGVVISGIGLTTTRAAYAVIGN